MNGKQGRKPTGRVNYIWVLAAMYLLFVAYQLFSRLWRGEADNPLVNLGGGAVFVVGAVWMLVREWRAYEYGKAHMDDPETWSDEPAEAETASEASAEDVSEVLEEPEETAPEDPADADRKGETP